MGLFDYINVKYTLPTVTESVGTSITQEQIQNAHYQTKDLDSFMLKYTIQADGQITYEEYERTEWVEDKSYFMGGYLQGHNLQTLPLHGDHVINFYDGFDCDDGDKDYWIEWQATIINGKLQSIKLIEFTGSDNTARKKTYSKLKASLLEIQKYKASFRYKYFFKYFDFIFNKTLKFIQRVLKFVLNGLNWVDKMLYRMRR